MTDLIPITALRPPPVPRLYTFRRCPYAIRARMALMQAGRDFEAVEVALRDKPANLLALSPKATVPVLHLPDGSVIEESWDMMTLSWRQAVLQGLLPLTARLRTRGLEHFAGVRWRSQQHRHQQVSE